MKDEIILYKSEDGKLSFDVHLDQDTVWLTQTQMAELFTKGQQTISEHIQNIFKENELDKNSVHRNFRYTAKDGKSYSTNHYNLDVIISVGYRVKSKRGTQFRIWATNVLRNHLLNGYSINIRKLESIENKIDQILKNDKLQNHQIKQLQEEQIFIKKMRQPHFIIHNNLETKSLLETKKKMADFEKKLEELNKILKRIDAKIPINSDLKIFLKDIQEKASKVHKDPDAKNKLLKTITDLGDSDSSISKMLTAAGVAQNIMNKTYEVGLYLVRHFPF